MRTRTFLAIATLAGATVVAPGWSRIERSPPAAGVYPLKHGIYVSGRQGCGAPPNAVIRQYDGRGISDPHSAACRVRVVARRGSTFVVDQSCVGAGVGPAPRFTERQTITVRDARTFSLKIRGNSTTYRYCPIDQLPADLRSAVR